MTPPAPARHRVRVWDWPTRLFHWALALAVLGLLVTGNVGGNAMTWHLRLGYVVLTLLLFRLCWGLVGGHWSRFARWTYAPQRVWADLRGQARPEERVGHSPLGALSVWAMFLALALQVGSGLFSDDEIAFFGPLTRFVSYEVVDALTDFHTEVGKFVVLALVVLHLLALLAYKLFKRRALVAAMWHGDKVLDQPAPAARDGWPQWLLAATLLGLCAAGVSWLVNLGLAV
jgi:cytochrome b